MIRRTKLVVRKGCQHITVTRNAIPVTCLCQTGQFSLQRCQFRDFCTHVCQLRLGNLGRLCAGPIGVVVQGNQRRNRVNRKPQFAAMFDKAKLSNSGLP